MRFKKVSGIIVLMFLSMKSMAVDPSVSVYIDHGKYTAAHVYEFDIMLKASAPTASFQLRTFQAGLYLNSSWLNGGTVTAQNASGYSELNGLGYNGKFKWNGTDKLLNCSVNFDVLGPVTCISTTATTTPLVVAKIRLINTADFSCASAPDIKFNYVSSISPLRLRTTFSWRETGCTTNYEMFYPGRTYGGTALFNGETYTAGDADGKSTVTSMINTGFCESQLALTAFLEGYYLGSGQMQPRLKNSGVLHAEADQADSVKIELRTAGNPMVLQYPPLDAIIGTTGKIYCILPNSLIGTSCWIVVRHKQSIDTWSKNPVLISSRTTFRFADLQLNNKKI